MAQFTMVNGDVFTGETAADVVDAMKASSPFTRRDSVEKYIAGMLPMIRGALPDRGFDIPDGVSAARFLELAQMAKLGVYTPTAKPGGSNKKGSLGYFGDSADSRAAGRGIPADPSKWPVGGRGRLISLADGRQYQLVNTTTGWAVAIGWSGVWRYLTLQGRAKGEDLEAAPRMTAAEAVRAAQLHAAA